MWITQNPAYTDFLQVLRIWLLGFNNGELPVHQPIAQTYLKTQIHLLW